MGKVSLGERVDRGTFQLRLEDKDELEVQQSR